MPGLDGMELIKKLKNINPSLRTILMTAFELDKNIFSNKQKRE